MPQVSRVFVDHVYEKMHRAGPEAVNDARKSDSPLGKAFRREEEMLGARSVTLLSAAGVAVTKFALIFRSAPYLEDLKRKETLHGAKRKTKGGEHFFTELEEALDEKEKWLMVYRNQSPEAIKETLKSNILKVADGVMANLGEHGRAYIHAFVLARLSDEVSKTFPKSGDFIAEVAGAILNYEPEEKVRALTITELSRNFPAFGTLPPTRSK